MPTLMSRHSRTARKCAIALASLGMTSLGMAAFAQTGAPVTNTQQASQQANQQAAPAASPAATTPSQADPGLARLAPRAVQCLATIELVTRVSHRNARDPQIVQTQQKWEPIARQMERLSGISLALLVTDELNRQTEMLATNPNKLNTDLINCVAEEPAR